MMKIGVFIISLLLVSKTYTQILISGKSYSLYQNQNKTLTAPVPIFYGPNESHSNDWAQCTSSGLIGICYYNKITQDLIYKTIQPNGVENEEVVINGENLEMSVLLFDSCSNPHIFVATSNTSDQIISHYYKNENKLWTSEVVLHFFNEGGEHIYELSGDKGPNNSFHLLVLKTRSNPDSDDFYYAFLNSCLYYITNISGSWQKNLVSSYNTIPPCDDYVKALNRQDIKVDRLGAAHIVFGKTPTNNFFPSILCYATNKSGEWEIETGITGKEGPMDDGGWFPSICLDSNGIPSVSCAFVSRIPTGSAIKTRLLYLTRLGIGAWNAENVVLYDDGYFGGDGRDFTGGLTHLVIDRNNIPHIVFTDIASYHSSDMQHWNLGNIRHAFKEGGEWSVSTIYRQKLPNEYYDATEMYGICLLISDDVNKIQVVGQELIVESPENYNFKMIHKIIDITTNIEDSLKKLSSLEIYPNPFNSSTQISFELHQSLHIKLQVFNDQGILISTLINTRLPSGKHSFNFHSNQLNNGVYLCKIFTPLKTETLKMIIIN